MNGDDNWMNAFGGHGPGHKVKALGREWEFVFDVPLVLANYEAMCLEWGRRELREAVESFPGRNTPGTIDAEMASEEYRRFSSLLRGGAFKPPTGGEFLRWASTTDGQFSMLAASLKIKHPEADVGLVMRMISDNPVEMKAIALVMGKVAGEWKERMSEAMAAKK